MEGVGGDGTRPPDQDGEEKRDTQWAAISTDTDEAMRMEVVESNVDDNVSKKDKKKKNKLRSVVNKVSKTGATSTTTPPKTANPKPTMAEIVKAAVSRKQTGSASSMPPPTWKVVTAPAAAKQKDNEWLDQYKPKFLVRHHGPGKVPLPSRWLGDPPD